MYSSMFKRMMLVENVVNINQIDVWHYSGKYIPIRNTKSQHGSNGICISLYDTEWLIRAA